MNIDKIIEHLKNNKKQANYNLLFGDGYSRALSHLKAIIKEHKSDDIVLDGVSKRFFVCEYDEMGRYNKISVEPYETTEKAQRFLNDMQDTLLYEDSRLVIINVC